jgi:hypothetical protein
VITESIVCVILRCSRCNAAFRDEVGDDYSGVAHWETRDDITAEFNKGLGEHGGWRCFGDRVVCSRCQITTGYADDLDAYEVPEPLPAAEADKVARVQAGYLHAERHIVAFTNDGWTIKHPLSCRPNLFECPVNEAAGRGLTEPPTELGQFVCDLDADGDFAIYGPAVEVSS